MKISTKNIQRFNPDTLKREMSENVKKIKSGKICWWLEKKSVNKKVETTIR